MKTTLPRTGDLKLITPPPSRVSDPPRHGMVGPGDRRDGGAGQRTAERAELSPAVERQASQMPAFAPLLEEIELAGWSSHRRRLSGNFHDWMLLADGRVMVLAGRAQSMPETDPAVAALVAQAAWTAVRAHAQHTRDAGLVLSLAARTLWPQVPSAIQTAVALALVDPIGGRASVAAAGDCLVWRIRAARCEQLLERQPALGAAADFAYASHDVELSLRERLLMVADDPSRRAEKGNESLPGGLAQLDAETHRRMTAADMAAFARGCFELAGEEAPPSVSVAAIRRR